VGPLPVMAGCCSSTGPGGFSLEIPRPELYYELLPAYHVKIHNARGIISAIPPGHPTRHRLDQRKGFTEPDYAELLDVAHQQLGGPLVVVWDNVNAHVSTQMTGLAAARDWMTVYRLPPYSRELNPVEMVWSPSSAPWPIWPNATSPSSPRWSGTGSSGCSTTPPSWPVSSPAPASTSHPSVTPAIKDL